MITCNGILVTVDFSDVSDTVLLYGCELARVLRARLHILHVISEVVAVDSMSQTELPEVRAAGADRIRECRRRIEVMVKNARAGRRRPMIEVREALGSAEEILSYAREHPIDLVVVGSHSHGAVARLLLGSVAETVVRAAPCPVLTVRRPERDFIKPAALDADGQDAPAT